MVYSSVNKYSCVCFIAEESQLRNAILETYEDAVNTIPLNPLVGNMGLPVDQLCVEVEMIEDAKSQQHKPKEDQDTKNKPIKSYRDLLYRDEKQAKRIFVRGKAGYGKTCYALRLVNSWKNAWMPRKEKEEEENIISKTSNIVETNCDNLMLEYDFVLYVAFRYLEREHKSVVDIACKDYFLSDTEQSEQLRLNMEKVLRSSHYKCLVILDGLDESKLVALPVHGQLQNCQLMYTSRPSKLDVISPRYDKDDKVVEILGLGNDLSQLVENILGQYYNVNDTKKQETYMFVMSKLGSITAQQKFLLRIPILAPFLIVQIYEGEEGLDTHSLTKAYLSIFQMLITKAIKDRRLPRTMLENFKEKKSYSKNFKSEFTFPLSKLGDLAYKDLANSTCLVFKYRELNETLDDDVIDFAINIGFISQSNVIGKTTGEKSAMFLHKSIQEFLAAFYLTCDDDAFEKFLKEHLCTIEKYINLSEVCTFLSGLKPALGSKLSERVVELANTDECIYKQRQDLLNGDNTYGSMDMLRRFTYTQCQCRWEFDTSAIDGKFHMTDLSISESMQEYMGQLTECKTVCHEMISIIDKNPSCLDDMGYRTVEEVCTCTSSESSVNEILKNSRSLRTFVVSGPSFKTSCSLHQRPVETKCISWPSTLVNLSISDVIFQHDTYCALNDFLANHNELNVLKLYNVRTTFDSGEGFCIAGCRNLRKLVLGKKFSFSHNSNSSSLDKLEASCTYRSLNQLLTEDNALEVLRLNGVGTNDGGKEGICISSCKNLTELSLRNLHVSYIDISECCKISTIILENLRSSNKKPLENVEINFPKRTIVSQTSRREPVENQNNQAEKVQTPDISKHGYLDEGKPLVEKTPLPYSSSPPSVHEGKSTFLMMWLPPSLMLGSESNENIRQGVISLPHKNQIRVLKVSNARVQEINVSQFYHLQELTLSGIVVPEKVVSQNDIFCSLSFDDEFEYIIDLANNEKLTKVELELSAKTKRHVSKNEKQKMLIQMNLPDESQIKDFVIRNVRLGKLDLTSVTQLHTLTLADASIAEVDLPHNKEFTHFCMENSFIRHIDLANAVMLRDVTLHFMSLSNKNGRNEHQSSLFEMQTLQGELNLQNIVHIQKLTIKNAVLQTLDLSPVHKLKTLTLCRVVLSQLDLSKHTEITQLCVSASCIQNINLANAVMLRDVRLELVSSVKESGSTGINFPHSSHTQDSTIEKAPMQKLYLSSVTKLERLSVHGTTMSEIDISDNKELTSLEVEGSSINHINRAIEKILKHRNLGFESTKKSKSNKKEICLDYLNDPFNSEEKVPRLVELHFVQSLLGGSTEEGNSLLSEAMQQQSPQQGFDKVCVSLKISLPNQNNIQNLTIENAVFQNMNFTLFPHLENLKLNRVLCAELVLSQNEKLTELCVSDTIIQNIYLENNKKLTSVTIKFFNRANNMMRSKGRGPPLPADIHLLHSPQIHQLTIENAKLENLNLSAVTNLYSLSLENVSVSEIDFQHNTKLSIVRVVNSRMRNVNIANAVKLCDLNLGIDPSTGKVRYDLTRHNNTHQTYEHAIVPPLREIPLPQENLSELDLSQNKERSSFHVRNSYQQFMNFANAAMLRDVNLSFEFFEEEVSGICEYQKSDVDDAVYICLPHAPYIQTLTIRRTESETLDLSPVTNLRKLRLVEVTVTELDLTKNIELTELDVTNCGISRTSISKSIKLKDVAFQFLSSKGKGTRTDSQQVPLEQSKIMKLDLSHNKKLKFLKLDGITLISSPDVRQARRVNLQDVQMDLDHWRDFADTLLSVRGECEVILKNINDNNLVVDKLKEAGFSTDKSDKFWIYPH